MKNNKDIEKLLNENLIAIMEYIKGSKNLEEAKENLKKSGFKDKSIEKVLKQVERRNILKFPNKIK